MPISHAPATAEGARAARQRFAGTPIMRTPLVRLGVEDAPAEIHLKLENLQPIGSFKIRGMWNGIACANERVISEGVWTLSAGNAAQGLAWSARRLGVRCTVVVPDSASPAKLRAVERLGAQIVRVPIADWFEFAAKRAVPGLRGALVHPFSDPAVMAGNGTIALEILEDLPDVEAVLVPWGGGGLCCGIAGVLRELAPAVKVFACEFSPTAPLHAALAAGEPVAVPYVESFVDGIGAPRSYVEMYELARSLVDGSIVSSLDEVATALLLILERNHVVAEGAAAVPVAAALSGAAGSGKVVCVLSGGNLDLGKLLTLAGPGATHAGGGLVSRAAMAH